MREGTFLRKKFPLALSLKKLLGCDFLQGTALHPPKGLLKKDPLETQNLLSIYC
jgi:hypothetical protein